MSDHMGAAQKVLHQKVALKTRAIRRLLFVRYVERYLTVIRKDSLRCTRSTWINVQRMRVWHRQGPVIPTNAPMTRHIPALPITSVLRGFR